MYASILTDDPCIRELAERAGSDEDARAVLLDALLEYPDAWRDERVMMLCLGVPMDPRPPRHLGEQGRRNWRGQRNRSIAFAMRQWTLYVGRTDHTRAIVSMVLFGGWPQATKGPSPWAVARRADPDHQARLAGRRFRRRLREGRPLPPIGTEEGG